MQWIKNEPMAWQRSYTSLWQGSPPEAARWGGAIWLYKRAMRHRISDQFSFSDDDLLFTDLRALKPLAVETPHWGQKLTRLCLPAVPRPLFELPSASAADTSSYPAAIQWAKIANFSKRAAALLQMPRRCCRMVLVEWFLPGWRQAPRQRASPFFQKVHDELTKSWLALYSACLRTPASSALSSVDGAKEKGYEKLPPLDESVATHLCMPIAIGWKAKVAHPCVQNNVCPRWTSLQRSRSTRRYPFPKRQGPRPKLTLDPAPQVSSWYTGQEEEGARSHFRWTTSQMASVMPPSAPFCSGCRWQCVCYENCCDYRARSKRGHTNSRCYSEKNKKRANFTFSKREQISSSTDHECQVPSRRSTTRTNPTPRYMGRGLAGHSQSVRLGFGDYKMRILTSVRSKTPAIQRHSSYLSAEQGCSRPALWGDEFAGKRSCTDGSTSSERVRVLQPLLPHPQKRWQPPAHPRSQAPEPRPHETAVQDDYFETDPLANTPRGLVIFSGSERRILSHPGSPPITDDSWERKANYAPFELVVFKIQILCNTRLSVIEAHLKLEYNFISFTCVSYNPFWITICHQNDFFDI